MAVEYLDKGNDDGTCLGQSATEKISFYGGTPATQPTGGLSSTLVITNSSATSACVSAIQHLQVAHNATLTNLRALGLVA